MLSLVGIDANMYRLVDIKSLKAITMTREELINYLKDGNEVDNVQYKASYLEGTNGNLSRYKDGKRSNSLVVLYKSIEKGGEFYFVSNSIGQVKKMDTDTLIREGRKYTIANGTIATIGRNENERVIIKSLRGSFREIKAKQYKPLDLEDYIKLYRLYSRIENGAGSTLVVSTSIMDVANGDDRGGVYEKKIAETGFNVFMSNYKIVLSLFHRFRDYTCERVFTSYKVTKVDKNLTIQVGEIAGYLLRFNDINLEVFIPAGDKNILQRIDKEHIKNLPFKEIHRLFTYDKEEPDVYDSIETSLQIADNFNKMELEHFKSELATNKTVEVRMHDDFTFNLGIIPKVKLRYNLNMKSRDISGLRGRLL